MASARWDYWGDGGSADEQPQEEVEEEDRFELGDSTDRPGSAASSVEGQPPLKRPRGKCISSAIMTAGGPSSAAEDEDHHQVIEILSDEDDHPSTVGALLPFPIAFPSSSASSSAPPPASSASSMNGVFSNWSASSNNPGNGPVDSVTPSLPCRSPLLGSSAPVASYPVQSVAAGFVGKDDSNGTIGPSSVPGGIRRPTEGSAEVGMVSVDERTKTPKKSNAEGSIGVGNHQDRTRASMAGPAVATSLDRNLECPICLDPMAVAAVLACGHSACWACVHQWCSMGTSCSMDCPTCHVSVPRGDFRRSVTLDKAIEIAVQLSGNDGPEWAGRVEKGLDLARAAEAGRRASQDEMREAEKKIDKLVKEVARLKEEQEQMRPLMRLGQQFRSLNRGR
ncbi:unnamed protein product, partial [Choristocarpus tenellus]